MRRFLRAVLASTALFPLACRTRATAPATTAPAPVRAQRHTCADSTLPAAAHQGRAFRFDLVQDGIYQAVSTGAMIPVNSPVVIVNDSDVVVVDPTATAAAACALLEEIKTITPKPVRVVVNTHFHFDHSNGNEVFGPDVEIVAHEFARDMIASGSSVSGRGVEFWLGATRAPMEALARRIDTTSNAARRDTLQRRLTTYRRTLLAFAAVVPTPPARTVSRELTLVRGTREIRLLHLGRGHTAGDLVVLLPRERVLITGDLLQAMVPYMGDAYFPEWIETLEALKELPFDVVIPGHGSPFRERARIDYLQSYLRDLWAQAGVLHAAQVSAEDAARRVDLRSHATRLSGTASVGVDRTAMIRAWELLEGKP